MDNSEQVFEYLKNALIAWRPKGSTPATSFGFDDSNVVDTMGTLPSGKRYDYVFMDMPLTNFSATSTGSSNITRSTQTFILNIYSNRGGDGIGAVGQKATLKAARENANFIGELFASVGFIVSIQNTEMNHASLGTIRQVMSITRVFIK